jgi:hypothetical protein
METLESSNQQKAVTSSRTKGSAWPFLGPLFAFTLVVIAVVLAVSLISNAIENVRTACAAPSGYIPIVSSLTATEVLTGKGIIIDNGYYVSIDGAPGGTKTVFPPCGVPRKETADHYSVQGKVVQLADGSYINFYGVYSYNTLPLASAPQR